MYKTAAPIGKEEQEEEENNVVSLKLITGGKEPPSTGSDWLSALEDGTIFYVQNKLNPMDFSLGVFRLAKREGKVVVLQSTMLPREIYVNPVRFCNNYLLYENMGVIVYKEEEVNSHDEHSPRGEHSEQSASADNRDKPIGGSPEGKVE